MLYFAADGGGTKLQMLAFDEHLHLLGHLRGPAVTTGYIPPELVRQGVRDTVRRLIDQLPRPLPLAEDGRLIVDALYESGVGFGPGNVLPEVAEVRRVVSIPEALCGLMAGTGKETGILTLAGTGSDEFWIENGVTKIVAGAYGPILGDEGSGYDLGRRTLLAAVRADDGRGPGTVLRDMVFREYGLKERMFELVGIVHGSPDTRKEVARATYLLGRAARDGDAVARKILTDGGTLLAEDTTAVLRRMGADRMCSVPVTVSGGAWKIHPLLWQSYRTRLLAEYPQLHVTAPAFDPVMAGVIRYVLDTAGTVTSEIMAQLKAEFTPCVLAGYFAE